MIVSTLTIDIEKETPGLYVARASNGGVLATEPTTHGRIDEAIRAQAQDVPADFAYFVKFTYGGMSTGTLTIPEAISQADQLADRLVALIAEQHRVTA